MEQLRRADAEVQHATHPRHKTGGLKWRLNRYNPKRRWNARKNRVMHPVEHEKMKARSKFNYMNPFFYIRRIKNNIKGVAHH